MADAVFSALAEDRFRPTELARGPWDAGALHGGAPAALLMRAFERLPSAEGLLLTRVTYELLRPVPLDELVLRAEVVRPGKRVQLLEGSLATSDGTEVVRARALRIQRAALDGAAATQVPLPPPSPDTGAERPPAFTAPQSPTFFPEAIEIRFVAGGFGGGPSTGWFRLKVPVVAGEDATPLQRLAAAADFGNGISTVLGWDEHLFINPDLTIYLDRQPEGEWVCLDAHTLLPPGGAGIAESVLYDSRGRVGRAIQSLLVAPR
jgi:acyl-coenzyme A thioesterase PaaI-like protein